MPDWFIRYSALLRLFNDRNFHCNSWEHNSNYTPSTMLTIAFYQLRIKVK